MTLSASTARVQYNGDDATTAFTVTFKFYEHTELTVILTDTNGDDAVWVKDTDYTVTGGISGGDPATGTVTATTAPATGETLTILRNMDFKQETDFPESGAFPAKTQEQQHDKSVMSLQQLAEEIDRAIKSKASSASTDLDLPDASDGDYIGWSGSQLANLNGPAAVTYGQHTIYIPAHSLTPLATNGPARASEELATNDIMVEGLDFDTSTIEFASINIQFPKSWDLGTLVAQFIWKDGDTAGTGGVVWGIAGLATGDGDAMDATVGTWVDVADTFVTADDAHISAETGAVTVAGTLAAEDVVHLKIHRNTAHGSDTYDQDARLIGVKIHYTTNTDTDD